ncbi:conserved hypothetical protein [Bosea sp. 62]|uniref:class I SAM-dependent methyltransferase n=1 Tax=unclassified Bosea (in: a-proteobacteria) TaxID=2653178 RepID=UPI001252FC79|nr:MULTISPECIES: class I SAM-dependent methyltransferase [unclassified Bosea (in: a-proteobacteria)]CAD5256914.1 conserved hypothetical protein [Bosea sp. 7B]CAD5273386.1 conserved hypothetical protein [Bosea sp. 21B]CAD5284687.1 conserved hypothetical protein [Bosea sp. 46]VVT60210.1 conserved hypothetical protein [Bosea sp. EC-HK365B]VXB59306.1 conserved hypothetical protein [Bosea sp. 62]
MPAALPLSTRANASSLDPLALYASAIDTSDYASRVAPLIRQLAPGIADLVDVGAGGGQLGAAIRGEGAAWTAIEPSPVMQGRLALRAERPQIIPLSWDDERIICEPADTVLAATMPGYFHDPLAFLACCRRWARRQIVWVVPAQATPKGLILAACLPHDWHGEDETPGIDLVLPRLGSDLPDRSDATDWTFSLVLPDLAAFAAFQADRLGWTPGDPRRPQLFEHLHKQAVPTPAGFRLSCHRRSAILVWNLS